MLQMGAGEEPEPDGETDQDMVPEPPDEVQEELTATGSEPGCELKFWI